MTAQKHSLWWWIGYHFFWKIGGPVKWWYEKKVLLFWCWRAIRKYHGCINDSVYGDSTSYMRELNYLRAILSLYFAVQGKGAQYTWITYSDVHHILNWNRKYVVREITEEFNDLIYRWQMFSHDMVVKDTIPLPPHRRKKNGAR